MAQQNAGATSPARVSGLGTLAKISDVHLIHIFGFLDSKTLARRISLTSKAFYIFSNFDELWKDLTISERRVLVINN